MDMSTHAKKRSRARGISQGDIELVLQYGQAYYARGAKIWFLGKREANRWMREEGRLRDLVGIHLVCSTDGSTVMTTYRNRNRTSPTARPGRKTRIDYTQKWRRVERPSDRRSRRRSVFHDGFYVNR